MTDDDSNNGNAVAEAELTAADAYARRLRRCGVMVDWLVGQLEAHAGGPGGRPVDWAAVGDLGEAERRLAAVLAFLVGTDEAAITAAVDEAVG